MGEIIIKHPRDPEATLNSIELSLYNTKGDDCGFTKDTVQALIDKIKEQDRKIKDLESVISWQDEDISLLREELDKTNSPNTYGK